MCPGRTPQHPSLFGHCSLEVDVLAGALRLAGSRGAAERSGGSLARAHTAPPPAHYWEPDLAPSRVSGRTKILPRRAKCSDDGISCHGWQEEMGWKVSESVFAGGLVGLEAGAGEGGGGGGEGAAARKDVCRTNRQRQHGDK